MRHAQVRTPQAPTSPLRFEPPVIPGDDHVYVIRHNRVTGVHAPGVPTRACLARGCTAHTSDWRAAPGGGANAHRVVASMVRTPLEEALSTRYRTEAHMAAYEVRAPDGAPLAAQPRVAKDALPWLRAEGYQVMLVAFLADWDTPGHQPWTPDELARLDDLWARAPGPLATCGLYLSPKGARLIQPITRPLPVEEGEASLAAWLASLVAAGLPPSVCDVHDWTRLMRTPHHRRPTGEVSSPRVEIGRMTAIDPPAGAPLPARPRRPAAAARPAAAPTAWANDCPPAWAAIADAVGAAIRDHVVAGWRRCYLALAGALLARGCDPGDVPAVVGRAHLVDPRWAHLLPDRLDIARTTVVRWSSGLTVSGEGDLRAEHPEVAAALDARAPSPTEGRVRRQLAAPAAPAVPASAALEVIAREIAGASGVVLIAASPGTGKTRAVVDAARRLPVIDERAAPGQRIAVSSPRHDLARQTAAQLPGRALHVFSPPSLVGADGEPVCVHAESARHLAGGRQSVRRELCEGRNKSPCERLEACPAAAGSAGAPKPNLVAGVHGLVRELRGWAGTSGTLVVDEPGEVAVVERITRDDLETAGRYLDAFVDRYAAAVEPALKAFTAWLASAPPAGEMVPLPDALRAAAPVDVVPDLEGAILPGAPSKAPPLRWRSVAYARVNPARAAELGRASRVLDLLWRGVAVTPFAGARVEEVGGERVAALVSLNEDLREALLHTGPVVVLDANAALHAPAMSVILGGPPRLVEVAVADGAPIERTVIACRGATRSTWLPRGVPDWDAGILTALRAVVAWVRRDEATRKVALIAPLVIEAAIAAALKPGADVAWPHARALLDGAVARLAPVLAGLAGRDVVTGHFGALEGLDHMADCDATVTLGDPRPNLGDEELKASYLGGDADGRVDALAAAELQQAHGRLRTIHRTRPGRQLHVGAIVPAGWAGAAVTVEALPGGRPSLEAAMTCDAFADARARLGAGVREFARALKISDGTVRRYESGERPVPADVARAVRALAQGAPETPCENIPYQGVSGAPPLTRGFGRRSVTGGFGRSIRQLLPRER